MGNRAIITNKAGNIGIYLHWNGSPDSVAAFCQVAKQFNVRGPDEDETYCFARMAQIIGNYLGETTGLGVGNPSSMDDGDNGIYVIDDSFNFTNRPQAIPNVKAVDRLLEVNKAFFGASDKPQGWDKAETETPQARCVVSLVNGREKWFLKGTTWTSQISRADKFDTVEDAKDALAHAKKFTKPNLYKIATFEPVEG